jgi:uncharacterized membrane protein YgdD (TMEM256/DUF423 family)
MQLDERKRGVVADLIGFLAVSWAPSGAPAVADAHIAALVETASLYELIHAGATLWLCGPRGKYLPVARWLFLIGTVLFCGSLYLKAIAGWDTSEGLAPSGGVSFMLGWLVIALEYCTSTAGTNK